MIYEPTQKNIEKAAQHLKEGNLIALPTETVYGLAADATNDIAVAKIYELKNRPTFNPLIVHSYSPKALQEFVEWNNTAEALAQRFWPGPLTMVLPMKKDAPISLLCTAGLETLAVRVPSNPIAQKVLENLGKPVAAPSANPSGHVSPTQAEHVHLDFPDLFILEGGDSSVGLESTILDLTQEPIQLLRPGQITQQNVEAITGSLATYKGASIKAPGMMKSHYAPKHKLRLNIIDPKADEAYLAFGKTQVNNLYTLNLSTSKNLTEAAANLFKMLRQLDSSPCLGIAVAPIPNHGIGEAINDRLQRAAAPRET